MESSREILKDLDDESTSSEGSRVFNVQRFDKVVDHLHLSEKKVTVLPLSTGGVGGTSEKPCFGIVKSNWVEKHASKIPAVVALLFHIKSSATPEDLEKKHERIHELLELNKAKLAARGIKFFVGVFASSDAIFDAFKKLSYAVPSSATSFTTSNPSGLSSSPSSLSIAASMNNTTTSNTTAVASGLGGNNEKLANYQANQKYIVFFNSEDKVSIQRLSMMVVSAADSYYAEQSMRCKKEFGGYPRNNEL